MSSSRDTILKAIIAQLRTITVAGGYNSDLGLSVHEWRPLKGDGMHYPFEEDELPAVIVRDISEIKIPEIHNVLIREIKVIFEIVCQEGITTPTKMREMIYDVEKCLRTGGDYGGLITQVILGDDEMIIHQSSRIIGGANIEATIQYRTTTI
jgi:hypothetical protein